MENDFSRVFWKSFLLNLLAGVIGMVPFLFLGEAAITWGFILIIIAVLSLLIQLIVSLVYISNPAKAKTGQAMLLSVGIYLLIGFAICGPILLI
jgi:hypothetical protein